MFRTVVTMSAVAAMIAPAFAMEWMTDLEAAKKKAAAENKLLLVDFTGSDWCYYCKLLSEKVFATPEFEAYAQGKFVPVEIDMPRHKKLAPDQLSRNKKLCEQYRVSGFPTVLVLSPEGDLLGGFVGGLGSLADVKAPLDAAAENGQLLAASKAAKGVERAKAFAAVYNNIPEDFKTQVESYKQEVLDNDKDNATGFRDVLAAEQEMRETVAELQKVRDFPAIIALIDQKLTKVMPANKVQLMFIKSRCQTLSSETVEDILKAKQTALEAVGLMTDAAEAEKSRASIEKEFADPAELLKKVQRRPRRR